MARDGAARSASRDLVAALRAVLAAQPGVRMAVLFGSRARGTARPDSDADVGVLGRDVDPIALSAALSRACGFEVDVVSLDDPGVPLLEQIVDDGLPVYEAAPGVFAQWRSHVLCDLETDRPWYARMRDAYLARVAQGTA
jgi:predicted nucleotidyltransferase